MFLKQLSKKFVLGMALILSVFLVACGRDVSTVENALEGTWAMNEAYVNGEPLEEVVMDNASWFGIDESEITTNEEGEVEYDVEFFYEDGVLTVVNSEGETTETTYEILTTDEESDELRLEYTISEEDMTLVIQEDVTFTGENRESKTSALNIVDIEMAQDPEAAGSELEQQLEQFGQDIAREIFQSIDLTLHFEFVSEDAPAEVAE